MPRLRPAMSGLLAALLMGQGCHLAPTRIRSLPATPGEGLIGQAGAGVVANNAGTLTGTAVGPTAALIANNGGGLIANNGGGLISNNGGGLAGKWRTLADDARLGPVADASVTVTDLDGQVLSAGSVTTDSRGAFTIKKLKPSGALVVVQVRYTLAGQPITLNAIVPAPRQSAQTAEVTPAATLITKKVTGMIARRALDSGTLTTAFVNTLVTLVAARMSDKAIALAALASDTRAAQLFDTMLTESPALAGEIRTAAAGHPARALINETPAASASATPGPSSAPGATPSSPSPSSTTPTIAPSEAPRPRLVRLSGGSTGGYDEATGGDPLTARFTELSGLAYDGADTLYVADESGDHIRAIRLSTGLGTLLSGSPTGTESFSGDGGPADKARFHNPHGLAVGEGGKLYICDKDNGRVRVIGPDRRVDTVVGGGADTTGNGPGTSLKLGEPRGIATGAGGAMYFTTRTVGTAYEGVFRLQADGTVKLLTDHADISSPDEITVDRAGNRLYFGNRDKVMLLRQIDGTPPKPEVVFTAPATGQNVEVRGLAHDQAGTLYVMVSDYDSGKSLYGYTNTRVYRLGLGATGLAAGTAVALAGSGANAAEADYSVAAAGIVDPLGQALTGNAANALALGPAGTLIIANAYQAAETATTARVRWGQILRLGL